MNDDIAVGGGKGPSEFGSEQPPSAASSGPTETGQLEQRVLSKNWQVRAAAFEELGNTFKGTSNKKDPIFNEYGTQFIKKFLTDSNPSALEKAIGALEGFINSAHTSLVSEYQDGFFKVLVEKGATHAKANVKSKAVECILVMLEITERFDEMSEPMVELLKNKNIKVQQAGISTLTTILREFGFKKLKLKDYLSSAENLANSSNPAVRGEAMNFYKEAYRWIKDALKPMLEKLKKAQVDELEKAFAELKDPAKPNRYTRKDAKQMKDAALDEIIAAEEAAAPVDAYDLSEPQDILKEFGAEWCDKLLGLKKWNEKKETLEQLFTAASVPKIKNGNFTDLTGALKKLCGDSNANVAHSAIRASGALAKGLRKNFEASTKELFTPCQLKFKEKKQLIIDDIHVTLDAFYTTSVLDELTIFIVAGINDKAPGIRKGTASFLDRAVQVTFIDILQRNFKEIVPALVKMAEDSSGEIRDKGLESLGIFKGRLGEAAMSPYIGDFNPQKTAKINEASQTVKPSKYDRPEKGPEKPKKAGGPPAKKKAVAMTFDDDDEEVKAAPPKSPKKPVKKAAAPPKAMEDDDMISSSSRPPKPAPAKRPVTAAPKAAAAPKKAAGGGGGGAAMEEDVGAGLSKQEAEDKVVENVPSNIVKGFEEAKWQDKVEAYKQMGEWAVENQAAPDMCEAICKYAKARMKDWKESNPNLVKGCLAMINCMATGLPKIGRRAVSTVCPFLGEKLGDVKVKESCNEVLLALSELASPGFVVKQVVKHGSSAKAPNVLKEIAFFQNKVIEEFGVNGLPLKEMIDYGILLSGNSNAQVRTAALSLFSSLYQYVGEPIRNFLTGIKDSTLKLIEDEFAKVTVVKPNQASAKRGLRGEAAEEAAATGGGGLDDALGPRADISKQITSKMLKNFSDSNWKTRKEQAEAVEGILTGANNRIKPDGLHDLIDEMKKRMADPNKSVIKAYIQCLGHLAEALGPAAKQFAKRLLPGLLGNLADKQSLVRNDVLAAANKWAEAAGADLIISFGGPLLAQENPEIRTEMLNWILTNKESIPQVQELGPIASALVKCLLDKSPQIRTKTEELICEIMPHAGYPIFSQGAQDLKPALRTQVSQALDKCKSRCGATNEQDQMNSSTGGRGGRDASADPREEKKAAKSGKAATSRAAKTTGGFNAQRRSVSKNRDSDAAAKPPVKPNAVAARPKKGAEEESSMCIIGVGNREKRSDYDRKYPWKGDELRRDNVEKFDDQVRQCFGEELEKKMRSNDFKLHIKCLDYFVTVLNSQPETVMGVQDLIIKWSIVKLHESANTSFAKTLFEFFEKIIKYHVEEGMSMIDTEAHAMLSLLADKSGLNNKILADKVKALIKSMSQVVPGKQVYRSLVTGLALTNLKSRGECLDEIAYYIEKNGNGDVTDKDVKLFAKCVDSNDKFIRENSARVLQEIAKLVGESIWKTIDDCLTTKSKSLLEQRFKKIFAAGVKMASSTASTGASHGHGHGGVSARPTTAAPARAAERSRSPMTMKNEETKNAPDFSGGMKAQTPRAQGFKAKLEAAKALKSPHSNVVQQPIGRGPVREDMAEPNYPAEENIPVGRGDDMLMDLKGPTLTEEIVENEGLTAALRHINSLRLGTLSERVDALVALNDLITSNYESNKESLRRLGNELVNAFTHVLLDIFEKPVDQIPLRFAKYFLTIVHKICSLKDIMKDVSEAKLQDLAEQLLTRLLIDGLDKVGENKEGEVILKNLNGSMLRLLENCNHTYMFCVLFFLLKKYKDFTQMPKLPGLIIKCLLKLSKILPQLINKINIEKILLSVHEYLVTIDFEKKQSSDEMGTRVVKTVINELVKLKRDAIWDAYQVIDAHAKPDRHVKKWINIILDSLNGQGDPGLDAAPAAAEPSQDPALTELKSIIQELNETSEFNQGIQKLHALLQKNPAIRIEDHLKNCSKKFAAFVVKQLEKLQKGTPSLHEKLAQATPNAKQESSFSSRMMEDKSGLKNSGRFGLKNEQGAMNKTGGNGGNSLNTSFSAAMNQSIGQQSKIGGGLGSGLKKPSPALNNTIGGAGGSSLAFQKNSGMNSSVSGQQADPGKPGGATSAELTTKLNDLKMKLQSLKKK